MAEEDPVQADSKKIEDLYREMMSGLTLQKVLLTENNVLRNPDLSPEDAIVEVEKETQYQIREEDKRDFRFVEIITVKSSTDEGEEKKEIFTISGRFLLQYRSPIEVNEELMEMFSGRNLSVHSWPYLREFIQSMSTRMGLPPMLLPLLLPKPQAG